MHENNITHSYTVNSQEKGKGFNYNGLQLQLQLPFLKVRDLKLQQVARCSLNICFPLVSFQTTVL